MRTKSFCTALLLPGWSQDIQLLAWACRFLLHILSSLLHSGQPFLFEVQESGMLVIAKRVERQHLESAACRSVNWL